MVTEATLPDEALAYLVNKPFDVAFIEWAPDFDGNDAVRKLRRNVNAVSRYVPVIITSAYTEVHHVVTSRDAGSNQFLAKPFTAKLIYKHLQAVIEGHRLFVQSKVFVGPDRRRRAKPAPDGSERRSARPKDA
jgi:DNA-binding response OmpR family regulator